MGRGKYHKRGGGAGGRRRGGGGGRLDRDRQQGSYAELVKSNERLEEYYNGLLGLSDEVVVDEAAGGETAAGESDAVVASSNMSERAAFWAAFRRELPHSFRFCGSKGHAAAVQKLLQTRYIPELARISHWDGLPVSPPKPVPWYPDQLAWWMTTSKTVIRKFAPFSQFQKFLVSETSVGNISRQEVVSMIPPLLLDVRPGMAVLDLCAAPGSKAAQLLEMIHQGEEARVRKVMQAMERGLAGDDAVRTLLAEEAEAADVEQDESARLSADPCDDGRATGILIANDADYKRSHLLIHQLKRLSSPNMIVTNHDATIYPSLRLPPLPAAAAAQESGDADADADKQPKRVPQRYLKFDRILADVPCSGDGTLRKNVNLWKDWSPSNALGLHTTQLRILVRALQMLKPGGRVVYSTCSLNPVENEAVVAAAVQVCGGPDKVEILDSSDQLPQLKRRPGLRNWTIMDKSGRQWTSWAEVEAYARSEEGAGSIPARLVESMFASEATARLPLERCLRVYPHLQDTGGFFIVVLQKQGEIRAKPVPNSARSAAAVKKAVAAEAAAAAAAATAAAKPETAETTETETVKAEERSATVSPAPAPAPAGETKSDPAEAGDAMEDVQASVKRPMEEDTAMDSSSEGVAPAKKAKLGDAVVEEPADEEEIEITGPRSKNDGPYEEPFKYLAPDHEVVQEIRAFYQLSVRFPADRYLVRNAYGRPAKAIYYTSGLVRDILASNTSDDNTVAGAAPSAGGKAQNRVRFVHAGVRMFVKQEAPSADVCQWRIQSEGMPLLQGYVGPQRVVRLHRKATLRALLVEMFPKFADGGWRQLGEVGEQLPNMGMGCFVLKVEPEPEDHDAANGEEAGAPLEPMALPLWKSFQSLNLMLPKEDRAAMLLRIFNDTTPLVNNSLDRSKDAAKASEDAPDATAATDAPPAKADAPDAAADADLANSYDAEDAPSS